MFRRRSWRLNCGRLGVIYTIGKLNSTIFRFLLKIINRNQIRLSQMLCHETCGRQGGIALRFPHA
ncbi:protein of unknown function [Rhodovastum atsumiense]|nr:protein of unknown function [Rhodovastum atsumiense]